MHGSEAAFERVGKVFARVIELSEMLRADAAAREDGNSGEGSAVA